jgi:hypothetical protein
VACKSEVSLFIFFCLDDLSIDELGVLKALIPIVLRYICIFIIYYHITVVSGCIVTFTKVLTAYIVRFIPSIFLLYTPSRSHWPIFIHEYIVLATYFPSLTLFLCPPHLLVPTPRKDLFYLSGILFFFFTKTWSYKEFYYDIFTYIYIYIYIYIYTHTHVYILHWIGSSLPLFSFLP